MVRSSRPGPEELTTLEAIGDHWCYALVVVQARDDDDDSESTLPFGAGVLPPGTEASSGPNAHPIINLLQVFANLRRMLQCSCPRSPGPKKCLPKNSHRFSTMAQNLPKRCTMASSSSLQSGHRGSSILLNMVRCRFTVLCPVKRPTNNFGCVRKCPVSSSCKGET